MKRKLILALSVLSLAMASCGKQGHLGTYTFQMGKNSGTHGTVSMTLKGTDYVQDAQVLGKYMTLYGEAAIRGSSSSSSSSVSSTEASSTASSKSMPNIGELVADALAKGVQFDGYYRVGEDRGNGRKLLSIGFSLPLPSDTSEEAQWEDISYDIIEKFIFSEIDSNKIYLQIPVSFTDLSMQLYWYGIDLPWLAGLDKGDLSGLIASLFGGLVPPKGSIEESSSASSSSVASSTSEAPSSSASSSLAEPIAHEVGSKPTKEEIDEINKTYPATHGGLEYHSFYTVSLALTRQ